MRIEIPRLPPSECSPNWRGPWVEKYQAGREYQAAVFYYCIDARNRARMVNPYERARLNLAFVFGSHRRRDGDNLLARFKPGLDGIVQAKLIEDDPLEHLQMGVIKVIVDPKRAPLTVIELIDCRKAKLARRRMNERRQV